ncbi:MAG: hypothetical protein RIS94_3054, partial [Pseudomonadota bacterium]
MPVRCRPLLGTYVEVTVPDGAEGAADAAFAAMAHVHAAMSFHDAGSDLARLRAAAAGDEVTLDPQTVRVLRVAKALFEATGGLFDVCCGRALVRAGFLPRAGIARLTDHPGTTADIAILSDTRVRVHRRVLVDLGGIAKGHAVDLAIEVLHAAGVAEGLVNAGGDLRAFGPRDWPVALRDADGEVRFMVPARDCAIATSANLDTRRRHRGETHSPHIGRAGKSVLAPERVTVVAPTCIIADALTKVAMADPA